MCFVVFGHRCKKSHLSASVELAGLLPPYTTKGITGRLGPDHPRGSLFRSYIDASGGACEKSRS